jgi:hypothetical protein
VFKLPARPDREGMTIADRGLFVVLRDGRIMELVAETPRASLDRALIAMNWQLGRQYPRSRRV